MDTIEKCAALADKNRELIDSLRRVVGQLGFVDLDLDEDARDRVMQAPDDEIVAAVEELYPADTVTRGVKTSMVAEYLGISCRGSDAVEAARRRREVAVVGGTAGATYAPNR